ncbi:MAG: peptidylprolyl isomerase [Betaproteobacteria bacterium]|nr:peptidylprolyl isomerase [Betaproteobacteria bacterium]
MKKQALVAIAAALLALQAVPASAQNVAIVNGKAVPTARLEALAQQVARSGRPVTPDMQGQLKEEIIAREIFAQAAQAQGLDGTDEFKSQMEQARQSILIRELFMGYQAKNPVSDAEVKAEFDRYAAANAGKEYKARHILVDQIKKGAKFDDLAKKASKDPGSAVKGGELDWANPGSYVKEFSDALVTLGKGKMTENPVKSQFGFHIIRVDDVREATVPKFDEVKPQIAQHLSQQKLAKYQEELRSKAKVE